MDLLAGGHVPERIAHHDTKLNNVMIDERTGQGICVIDLDTVMHGTVLYDFGDSVRFGAVRAAEHEPDLSHVRLDLQLFERLADGYLSVAGEFLTPGELDHLVEAGPAVTYTIGVRFLTDFLAGDVYFKTAHEGQNLERCRVQFALVADMQRKRESMRSVIEGFRRP